MTTTQPQRISLMLENIVTVNGLGAVLTMLADATFEASDSVGMYTLAGNLLAQQAAAVRAAALFVQSVED